MDVVLAKAILNEAKRGGFYPNPLPESDSEIVNDAIYFAEEAQLAYDGGWGKKQDSVVAIVNLLKLDHDDPVTLESNNGKEEPLGERSSSSETAQDVSDAKNALHIRDGREETPSHYLEELALKNNLPLPLEIDSKPPDMPRDITELTDIRIRKLYSEYNAFLNLAKWKLAIETSDLSDATHLRDDSYRKKYVDLPKIDEETGRAKSGDAKDMEAKTTKEYERYDKRVLEHTKRVTAFKALVDIYSSNVDRLSREMTFRKDEWEKSR